MSTPKAIIEVAVTFADGTRAFWYVEDMEPGAHYWTSRNFTRPPRKGSKTDIRLDPETWTHHQVTFNTDRQSVKEWEAQLRAGQPDG